MKKYIYSIVMFVALCMMSFGALAQCGSDDYYTLGDENGYGTYMYGPTFYSSRYYNLAEYIVTKEELQNIGITAGSIKSLSFKCTQSPGSARKISIYLAHTEVDVFCATNMVEEEFITNGLQRVVDEQNILMTAGAWNEFVFDQPFEYDGAHNLLVVVADNTGSASTSPGEYVSMSIYNNGSNYSTIYNGSGEYSPCMTLYDDHFETTITEIDKSSNRPIMKFMVNVPTNLPPSDVNVDLGVTGAKICWTENGEATEWEIVYGPRGFDPLTSETSIITDAPMYLISDLNTNADYDLYVRSIYSDDCRSGFSEMVPIRTLNSGCEACISGGSVIDISGDYCLSYIEGIYQPRLPFNTEQRYNYSQSIYTADDLGITEGTIIGFELEKLTPRDLMFYANTLEIYMGHTSKSSFDSNTDWITDGLTLVYSNSGNRTFTIGFNYIEFTTPFVYDGSSNIVIVFNDKRNRTDYYSNGNHGHLFNESMVTENRTLQAIGSSPYTFPVTDVSAQYKSMYYPNIKLHVCQSGLTHCPDPEPVDPVINNIAEVDGNSDVVVYPNPFHNDITILLENFENRDAQIEIFDVFGRLIVAEELESVQNDYKMVFELGNLAPAAYNIRVTTNDFVIVRQIVKQ